MVAAVAAALAAGCAVGRPESESAGDGSDAVLDSFGLIEAAMAAGRIDYSTGILYKVYAVYEPTSLPEEYRSEEPLRRAASLVSEVERNWNRLSEDDRSEIAAYIDPPADPDEQGTGLDDVTPDRLEHERNRLD